MIVFSFKMKSKRACLRAERKKIGESRVSCFFLKGGFGLVEVLKAGGCFLFFGISFGWLCMRITFLEINMAPKN